MNLHGEYGEGIAGCELDGVLFHQVDMELIPLGYASGPVNLCEVDKAPTRY